MSKLINKPNIWKGTLMSRLPYVFAITILLAHIYLWNKTRHFLQFILQIDCGIPLVMLFVGVTVLYYINNNNPNFTKSKRFFAKFCTIYFSFLMYLFLFLVLADFSGLIVKLCIKNVTLSNNVLFEVAFILAVIVCFFGFIHRKVIKTIKYSIKLGDNSNKYKVALISDIHIGDYVDDKHLQKIVDRVNRLNADAVFIAGDILNDGHIEECKDINATAIALSEIKCRDGVFAVLGNHDTKNDNKQMIDFLKNSNIKLLTDEIYENKLFTLIGRVDYTHLQEGTRKPLAEIKKTCSNEKPILILDHNPRGIDEAVDNNCNLIMCGHTHKGQMFPLNCITKLIVGKTNFWGYGKINNTHTIITSGAGYFQIPLRIGTNNEVVEIEINI